MKVARIKYAGPLLKYDPDQLRDDTGRWSTDGGSNSGSSSGKSPGKGGKKLPAKKWAESMSKDEADAVDLMVNNSRGTEAMRDLLAGNKMSKYSREEASAAKKNADALTSAISRAEPSPGEYHMVIKVSEKDQKKWKDGAVITLDAPATMFKTKRGVEDSAGKGFTIPNVLKVNSKNAVDLSAISDKLSGKRSAKRAKNQVIEPKGSKFRLEQREYGDSRYDFAENWILHPVN
jgi:hypothetical protein